LWRAFEHVERCVAEWNLMQLIVFDASGRQRPKSFLDINF